MSVQGGGRPGSTWRCGIKRQKMSEVEILFIDKATKSVVGEATNSNDQFSDGHSQECNSIVPLS